MCGGGGMPAAGCRAGCRSGGRRSGHMQLLPGHATVATQLLSGQALVRLVQALHVTAELRRRSSSCAPPLMCTTIRWAVVGCWYAQCACHATSSAGGGLLARTCRALCWLQIVSRPCASSPESSKLARIMLAAALVCGTEPRQAPPAGHVRWTPSQGDPEASSPLLPCTGQGQGRTEVPGQGPPREADAAVPWSRDGVPADWARDVPGAAGGVPVGGFLSGRIGVPADWTRHVPGAAAGVLVVAWA